MAIFLPYRLPGPKVSDHCHFLIGCDTLQTSSEIEIFLTPVNFRNILTLENPDFKGNYEGWLMRSEGRKPPRGNL